MTKRFFLLSLSSLALIFCSFALGESDSASARSPSAEALRTELEKVLAEIATAQRDLNGKMEELRERQHRLEYEHPEIVSLREELLALERQALQKREEIRAKLSLIPEIRRIEEERRDYFRKLSELRETEAAIRRELAAREREE
jgi:predicted  nucleic acid-binding Zn-ribbon protein